MGEFINILDKKGQLTLEARTLYAQAMHLSLVERLPQELTDYVWANPNSMQLILDLYHLLDEEMVHQDPLPFLKNILSEDGPMYLDWENLDDALEDILRAALAEQTTPNRAIERKMGLSFKKIFSRPSLKVIMPEKDAVCIHTILFQFSQATAQPCLLSFKSAGGQSKGQFTIPKGVASYEVSVSDEAAFPTGLYYWTLLAGKTPQTNRLYICTIEDAQRLSGRT